ARPRRDRRADAADVHRRGRARRGADPSAGSGGGAAGALAVRRGALRLRPDRRLVARTGLRAQGPCRGRRGLPRRDLRRGRGRDLAGPRGGPADLRPLATPSHARGAHAARARGARSHGPGQVQPGDRRRAVRLGRKRREAHLLAAHQARPAARGRGEPARDGGAALPGVGGEVVTMVDPRSEHGADPAARSRPEPRYDPPRRLEPSPERDRPWRRGIVLAGGAVMLTVVLALGAATTATWLDGRHYAEIPATTGIGAPTALQLTSTVGDVRVQSSPDVEEVTVSLVAPGTTVPAADG